jgi:hypothetical protein
MALVHCVRDVKTRVCKQFLTVNVKFEYTYDGLFVVVTLLKKMIQCGLFDKKKVDQRGGREMSLLTVE